MFGLRKKIKNLMGGSDVANAPLLREFSKNEVESAFRDIPLEEGFRSRFGGLWPDRNDADIILARRLAEGSITQQQHEQIIFWRKNGYLIIPNAVAPESIDALKEEIETAWEKKDKRFSVQTGHGAYIPLAEADRSKALVKLLDFYVYSQNACKVGFSTKIIEFLKLIFEKDVLAFQNLTFEVGSTQSVHQDTAYVVTSKPMQFAASWIALEDIEEGSGELVYYPGSHQYEDYLFGGKHKHWDIERDGKEDHQRFAAQLHEKARERGLVLEKFRPKKGDALIWSADLAHGGGEITKPGSTRKSYVTHYCPVDVVPNYFRYKSDSAVIRQVVPGGYISSFFYDVR